MQTFHVVLLVAAAAAFAPAAVHAADTGACAATATCGSTTPALCITDNECLSATGCSACGPAFVTDHATECAATAEATCAASLFCPAASVDIDGVAGANAGACVASCATCDGYAKAPTNAVADTCEVVVSGACPSPKYFCEAGTQDFCVADCTACPGLPKKNGAADGTGVCALCETATTAPAVTLVTDDLCPTTNTCLLATDACASCGAKFRTLTGNACTATVEGGCTGDSKKFCPATAHESSKQGACTAADDCTDCTGFTVSANTCTVTVVLEAVCTALGLNLCPLASSAAGVKNTCVASCSGCTDFTTLVGDTCMGQGSCSGATPKWCPSGPNQGCLADCYSCTGMMTNGGATAVTTCADAGNEAADAAVCGNLSKNYCPDTAKTKDGVASAYAGTCMAAAQGSTTSCALCDGFHKADDNTDLCVVATNTADCIAAMGAGLPAFCAAPLEPGTVGGAAGSAITGQAYCFATGGCSGAAGCLGFPFAAVGSETCAACSTDGGKDLCPFERDDAAKKNTCVAGGTCGANCGGKFAGEDTDVCHAPTAAECNTLTGNLCPTGAADQAGTASPNALTCTPTQGAGSCLTYCPGYPFENSGATTCALATDAAGCATANGGTATDWCTVNSKSYCVASCAGTNGCTDLPVQTSGTLACAACTGATPDLCPMASDATASLQNKCIADDTCMANCGADFWKLSGSNCVASDEADCLAKGSSFCPGGGNTGAFAGQCVTSCSLCVGYTGDGPTCFDTTGGVQCMVDDNRKTVAQYFCPAGSCVDQPNGCSGCAGFKNAPASGQLTCRRSDKAGCAALGLAFCTATALCVPSASTCAGSCTATRGDPAAVLVAACTAAPYLKLCPTGATAFANSCVADCGICTGYQLDGTTCVQGSPASAAAAAAAAEATDSSTTIAAVCGAVGGIVLLVTAVYCMKKKR